MEFLLGILAFPSPWTLLFTLFVMYIIYGQANDIKNKGTIAGPTWKMPFIGYFLESMDHNFEGYYAKWLSGPLSCFQKFVIIALTRDLARKTLNSPAYVTPPVDVAPKLLGQDNWVFLDGKAHIEFRKGLNKNFKRKSLGLYLPSQEAVYKEYFPRFIKITEESGGKPVPFMSEFRKIMCAVSLRTFVGYYISDAAVRNIADDFYLITAALELVGFPVILPCTKAWHGKKAADMVLSQFCKCAAKSRARMAAGGDVACLMDAWTQSMVKSQRWREAEEAGDLTEDMEKPQPLVRMFNDCEIAQTVFTFLFSSQDSTSSAVAWLFQVVTQRPDVLEKVREENMKVRNGVIDAELNMEQLESLTYTRAVVRELLRYRRPMLMVPYQVKKWFPITDIYTVPKGSMSIPTTYTALYDPEVYENPDNFDPERYYSSDAEEKGAKNHLMFGIGPHCCIGQLYTTLNLALCLGKASIQMDWQHHATPKSEEIKVFASIFPMDDCPLTFQKRGNW